MNDFAAKVARSLRKLQNVMAHLRTGASRGSPPGASTPGTGTGIGQQDTCGDDGPLSLKKKPWYLMRLQNEGSFASVPHVAAHIRQCWQAFSPFSAGRFIGLTHGCVRILPVP